MIILVPLTSAFHVLYHLKTEEVSISLFIMQKSKVTQEVSSGHDSNSGMMIGKIKIFPLQSSFHRRENSFYLLVLPIPIDKAFPLRTSE